MTLKIDETTEFGGRVRQRLAEERLIWLTTSTPGGKPAPSLVWFFNDGDDTVLIWSQPNKPKVNNIASNPTVALNFNSDPRGNNLVVFDGTAETDRSSRTDDQKAAYLEKYGAAIIGLGYPTPEAFFDDYSVPIRVSLTKVRGF